MKKLFLFFALMLTVCSTAMAQSVDDCFTSGNLRYKITSFSPNTVEVTTVSDIATQHYSMTSVTIPGNVSDSHGKAYAVTKIAGGETFATAAFYGSKIETITFAPNSQVTEIGDYAFYKSAITAITLPASLTTIGKSAFAGCTALADVTVTWTDDASIPTPGTNAFSGIVKGAVLHVPTGTVKLYKDKGWGQWFTIDAPLGTNEIWYTTSDSNVVTPYQGGNFGDANVVSNVYQDGKGVITFDKELTSIGDFAFLACTNLASVEIPNSVKSIGAGVFGGTSLKSITLSSRLENIGTDCFDNCNILLYVCFLGTTPPTYKTTNPFANTGKNVGGTALLVPEGAVESYTAAGYTTVFTQTNIKSEILAHIEKALNTDVPLSDADKASLAAIKEAVNSTTDIETMLNEYNEFKNLFKAGSKEAVRSLFWLELSIYTSPLQSQYIDRIGKAQSVEEIEAIVKEVQDYIIALKAKREEAKATVHSLFSLELSIYTSPLQSQYIERIEKAQSVEEIEAIVKEVQDYVAKYKEAVNAKREEAKNTILLYISLDEYYDKYHSKLFAAITIEEIEAIVNDFWNEFRSNNPLLEIGNKLYILKKGMQVYSSSYLYEFKADEDSPYSDIEWPDGTEYHLPSDALFVLFGGVKVNYSRTLPEGVWQCWHEPFRTRVDNSQFDAAEVAGILFNDEGEEFVAFRKLKDDAKMEGNTVYVIRAKEGHGELQFKFSEMCLMNKPLSIQSAYDTYTFYGTNMPKEHGDWYTLDKNGKFRQMASGSLKPQRFYMTITPRMGDDLHYTYPEESASTRGVVNYVVLGDDEDGTTGIDLHTTPQGKRTNTLYDLQGHSTTSIQKGQIYIMNGKKYIGK